jgi:hypothetical protein
MDRGRVVKEGVARHMLRDPDVEEAHLGPGAA